MLILNLIFGPRAYVDSFVEVLETQPTFNGNDFRRISGEIKCRQYRIHFFFSFFSAFRAEFGRLSRFSMSHLPLAQRIVGLSRPASSIAPIQRHDLYTRRHGSRALLIQHHALRTQHHGSRILLIHR